MTTWRSTRASKKPCRAATYRPGRDGAFDTFDIRNPRGKVIARLYCWDEPYTDEARQAERSARAIRKQINRWSLFTPRDTV
jgi:hypothetical protein